MLAGNLEEVSAIKFESQLNQIIPEHCPRNQGKPRATV
jgi:hypothetical protein